MLKKIGLIGGGYIGGVLAQEIAQRRLAREVGLVDPAPMPNPNDPPERQEVAKKQSVSIGKCLDIAEGLPAIGRDIKVVGSKDYSAIEGAELIINTAGVPRKARPDGTFPSREELLAINLKVTIEVAKGIEQYCPKAMIISIANPLDAIVYTLDKRLAPPKNRLFGMAGVLDSARYRAFVAEAANVSVENVNAVVLGGHGDDMVPVRSSCQIAGIPVAKFLDADTLAKIEARTRKAGGEVVGLLGFGSAFVSPAWSALEMAEAVETAGVISLCDFNYRRVPAIGPIHPVVSLSWGCTVSWNEIAAGSKAAVSDIARRSHTVPAQRSRSPRMAPQPASEKAQT